MAFKIAPIVVCLPTFVDWRVGGKRSRKWFPSKSAASTYASVTKKEVSEYGAGWASMSDWERAAAIVAVRRAKAGGYTLLEACDVLERHRHAGTAVTVSDLFDKHLQGKQRLNLRTASLRQIEIVQKAFVSTFGSKLAREITPGEIGDWLDNPSWGPRRRLGVLKELRSFFNFGIRQKLITENPARGVDDPIQEDKPTVILTVEQAEKLMRFARKEYPQLIPFLSVCLFAGLRTVEVMGRPPIADALTWGDIDLDRGLIRLSAGQAKTRVRRLVLIHDTCATWLTLEPKRTGKVLKHPTALKKFREKCGVWSRNVLRHSFISYELARTENETQTAARAGTSPEVIQQHYRELVTPDAAKKFWSILP